MKRADILIILDAIESYGFGIAQGTASPAETAEHSKNYESLLALADDAEPDLVEKVAEALYKSHDEFGPWSEANPFIQAYWMRNAEIAIAAIREHNGEGRTG